jgi:hypothetical protein
VGAKEVWRKLRKRAMEEHFVETKYVQNLEEDLDKYNFDEHCQMMYDVIFHESPKYADNLLGTKRFESIKFQVDLRQRLRERMFCELETLCSGEASRQLHKRGVGQMPTMREFFFRRFGAGQPEVVKERERVYLIFGVAKFEW